MFSITNTGDQALSTNSTSATGLVLSNPAGSGMKLLLWDVLVSIASLPAGQSSLILTGSLNPSATAVAATLKLSNFTVTAVTAGSGGNAVSFKLTAGATAGSEAVSVSSNAISVQIADG